MKLAETVTFGGSGLDRAAHLRGDADRQKAFLSDENTGILPIWRGKPLFSGEETVAAQFVPVDHPVLKDAVDAPIFLGLDNGAARYAQDISDWEPDVIPDTLGAFFDPSEQRHPAFDGIERFAELRGVMAAISARDAEMTATGKAVSAWHQTHRFCAKCSEPSVSAMAGWQRDCPACGAHHFPRTDPVVIMLITRGNSVLVGRSHGWPEGMYSLLAGFVEPGEPLEAAVRREVLEEAGIRVGAVEYLSSQPWPFPMSLMFGCRGAALDSDITLDPDELDDAVWVTREEMAACFAGTHTTLKTPRLGSIARFLLQNWLADQLD